MKYKINQEKGVTMIALVVTIIILLTITNMLIYNAQDSIHIKALTNLYNDIGLLRDKVSEYYNEYGKIPGEIKYTKTDKLLSVLSAENDIGHDFYVIDLEAMQGITLNYGKDYEKVKSDPGNCNNYTDIYIINENSHNIFYVQGISIKEKNVTQTYYTDYIEPDETIVDLRYIDGILIPEGYYYIGKYTDNSGNESIVISKNKNEQINDTSEAQYIWQKDISNIEKLPDSIKLSEQQNENEFIKSVSNYKGYFKNKNKKTDIDVIYLPIYEDEWSEVYTKESEYKDENGDIAHIPEGFRISMSPTMNIVKKGLVAKDEDDNEWVWIEVPKRIFTTAKNSTDYSNIKEDLMTYASNYRKGDITQNYNWEDEYYDGCGIVGVESKTASQVYTEMYNKMLNKIYTNGGFWISRYEAGIEGSDIDINKARIGHTNITETSPKAKSQKDMIPYNYVYCSEAQMLASNMTTNSNNTTSLLFGLQWDLVCTFLEENSDLEISDINSDSKSWGNYSNKSLTLNRGKYNISPNDSTGKWKMFSENTNSYVIDCKTSSDENYRQIITTGASEDTKKLNIYDFAGNLWEWTLEFAKNNDNKNSVCRGGEYYYSGNFAPAAKRLGNGIIDTYASRCFRVALY